MGPVASWFARGFHAKNESRRASIDHREDSASAGALASGRKTIQTSESDLHVAFFLQRADDFFIPTMFHETTFMLQSSMYERDRTDSEVWLFDRRRQQISSIICEERTS